MNKQEAIEKLEKGKSDFNAWEDLVRNRALEDALTIVKKIDEPEKPVVPQVAVEFYERYKGVNSDLGEWFGDFYSPEAIEFPRMDELTKWLHDNNNETNRQREFALATLVTLGIDAVEVEKEKLYLASFRDTKQYLGWNERLGEWFMSCSPFTSGVEQTREMWEGVRIWDNPAFEIKEVEE